MEKRLHGLGRAKYISPQIQADLLSIMSTIIQHNICDEIKQSKYYSVMIDESKDISHKEQISVVVRYIFYS